MYFALILEYTGLTYYGDIPEIPYEPSSQVEMYRLSNEDLQSFLTVVDDLDRFCNALIDNGDVDYFSGDKLLKLKEWLESYIKNIQERNLYNLLKILLEYTKKAITLNTGVVIELWKNHINY